MSKLLMRVVGTLAALTNIANARLTNPDEVIGSEQQAPSAKIGDEAYIDYLDTGIISNSAIDRSCLVIDDENPYTKFINANSEFTTEEELELANEILEQVTDNPLEYCVLLAGKNHLIDPENRR